MSMGRLRAGKMSVRPHGGGERVLEEYGDAVGVRGLVTNLAVPGNE